MFYDSVVPISPIRHGDWCVLVGGGYAFSSQVNSVPLTTVEFPHAAAEYVIVFAGTAEAVTPSVILGLRGKENLYLAGEGKWAAKYVPAFVRQYPFVFSSHDEGKTFTLCIDEGFAGCNRENRGERLFDQAGKPTQYTNNMLALLQEYQAQLRRTRAFCSRLKELGLLDPMRVRITLGSAEQVLLTGFMTVNRARLKALPAQALSELVQSDQLEWLYLHLQSMRNVAHLKDRDIARDHNGAANSARIGVAKGAERTEMSKPSAGRHSARMTFDPRSEGETYDSEFIFGECGFDWIPEWIDRRLLFNVSYDLGTGEIKLYFLDAARSTIFKVSGRTITKQYDAVRFNAPPVRLSEFLGAEFDYSDLLLDTVEDDVYYVLLEDTSAAQYLKFFHALSEKFGASEERLIEVINRINKRQVSNLRECHRRTAVSGVKVPFVGRNCKLYARPFLTGNSYELSPGAREFLTRFHGCSAEELPSRIRYLWVASELLSERVVITTQHHALVHKS